MFVSTHGLQVAHVPGMPGTFSPSLRVCDPDMHHGTCVTHVPCCMPGSLTFGFLWSQRKRSRRSRRMRHPQFYVSGKRPMIPPATPANWRPRFTPMWPFKRGRFNSQPTYMAEYINRINGLVFYLHGKNTHTRYTAIYGDFLTQYGNESFVGCVIIAGGAVSVP